MRCNRLINRILPLILLLLLFLSCKKTEEVSDLQKIRNNKNVKGYSVTKMDSTQAIESITRQKAQELLDLSALYNSGNGDTEIDSVIYAQMGGYFVAPDSIKINALLKPMDSLDATSAKVNNLKVAKNISGKDTVDYATFDIEYFNRYKKSVANASKAVSFTLKLNPVQFKKEFRFYFLDFNYKLPKDSTSAGVTR